MNKKLSRMLSSVLAFAMIVSCLTVVNVTSVFATAHSDTQVVIDSEATLDPATEVAAYAEDSTTGFPVSDSGITDTIYLTTGFGIIGTTSYYPKVETCSYSIGETNFTHCINFSGTSSGGGRYITFKLKQGATVKIASRAGGSGRAWVLLNTIPSGSISSYTASTTGVVDYYSPSGSTAEYVELTVDDEDITDTENGTTFALGCTSANRLLSLTVTPTTSATKYAVSGTVSGEDDDVTAVNGKSFDVLSGETTVTTGTISGTTFTLDSGLADGEYTFSGNWGTYTATGSVTVNGEAVTDAELTVLKTTTYNVEGSIEGTTFTSGSTFTLTNTKYTNVTATATIGSDGDTYSVSDVIAGTYTISGLSAEGYSLSTETVTIDDSAASTITFIAKVTVKFTFTDGENSIDVDSFTVTDSDGNDVEVTDSSCSLIPGNTYTISVDGYHDATYTAATNETSAEIALTENSTMTESFDMTFSASVSAGDLGYGVYAMEDMTYDGSAYIQGSTNPTVSGNTVTGAALKFVAAADGTLTVTCLTGSESSTKTVYLVQAGESDLTTLDSYVYSGSDHDLTCTIESGNTYYLYGSGTKVKIKEIVFTTSSSGGTSTSDAHYANFGDSTTLASGTTYVAGNVLATVNGIDFTVYGGNGSSTGVTYNTANSLTYAGETYSGCIVTNGEDRGITFTTSSSALIQVIFRNPESGESRTCGVTNASGTAIGETSTSSSGELYSVLCYAGTAGDYNVTCTASDDKYSVAIYSINVYENAALTESAGSGASAAYTNGSVAYPIVPVYTDDMLADTLYVYGNGSSADPTDTLISETTTVYEYVKIDDFVFAVSDIDSTASYIYGTEGLTYTNEDAANLIATYVSTITAVE